MSLGTERTSFSLDVAGRYVCNTWQEAMDSMDTSRNPGARPFDIIVIGGGTFGGVFASHLFDNDTLREHRILVLEAGPVALPEHAQNLPMLSTDELWGVPWNSDSPKGWNREFPGLAFAVGGRSLFWGGWSPYFIDSELGSAWPSDVVNDLTKPVLTIAGKPLSYLDHAAEQIGSSKTNDFVDGDLHAALKNRLFAKLSAASPVGNTTLTGHRGGLETVDDLEAPLAVQSTPPEPGFFPMNKFSSVPLITKASRTAWAESQGDDTRKRFMVVDNTHVLRLETSGNRISRIHTNQGVFDLPQNGRVFLALGTIENTRMALNTLPNAESLIGRNLMAHLRSNLTLRIRRDSFAQALPATVKALGVSALFVKGIHTHQDGTKGHFHIQITASGVGQAGQDSEAELFKKIPDIDSLDAFRGNSDSFIVITLRGIGEMIGDKGPDPLNRIILDTLGPQGAFDYSIPRALVRLEAGPDDSNNMALWQAMDSAAEEIALMFADGTEIQYLNQGSWQPDPPPLGVRRDKLSTTHHESGTLWMGGDQTPSVTDTAGKFKECDNLYALGPCLLPTMGSPNPMLSGVALARRTGDIILKHSTPGPEPDFKALFDGNAGTYGKWIAVGGGIFTLNNGQIVAEPGGDLGLIYYAAEQFGDFTLRLEFKLSSVDNNSGVFVRFRDPRRPVPDKQNPAISYPYKNQAFVGVDTGFEIQIDELARGNPQQGTPDGLDMHRTGAVYGVPVGTDPGQQDYHRGPFLQPGVWTDLEITVAGDSYSVRMKQASDPIDQLVTSFTRTSDYVGRGAPPSVDPASGFIGLQSHTGRVTFRNIRIGKPQIVPGTGQMAATLR